jgi:hypothetical protein
MRALIWKELRQHIKWAALPSLVILLVFLIDKPDEPMFLRTDAFLFCLTAVAFGAGLGFVQSYFEAHGDRRSLLLHLPLSASRIFLAKVLGGIGIYVLALGVPYLCLEIWMATPGKMSAPYHWRTSLPWLADILSGLVYYFAGILVAQRDVRWFGSRCLPLAAAFFCSYLVWTVTEFWQALVVIGVFGSFVGTAAWGSFASGGAYSPQPRTAKAALAITFLAGLLSVSIVGKQKVGEWLDAGIEYEYTIDREGQVLFQRLKQGVGIIERRNQDGQEVLELASMQGAPLVWTETPHYWSYRNSGRFYVKCSNDSKPGKERWYYDHAQGRLVGYDLYYHHLLGSFGPDGFTPAGRQLVDRFQGDLRYRSKPDMGMQLEYLAFPDRVYTVDYARRTIRTFFTPPAGETVSFASRWSDELDRKRTGLVISTDQSFHFLTADGSLTLSVPRLYEPTRSIPVLAGPLEKPARYVVCYPSYFEWTTILEPDEYRNLTCEFREYDLTGTEVASRNFQPLPYPNASYAQALFGVVTPMTEAVSLVGASRHLRTEARLQGGTQKPVLLHELDKLKFYIPGTAPDKATPTGLIPGYLALTLVSAAAFGLGCFFLARRYSFSRARSIGWVLSGFLFGWAGFVLMLALQEWPARVVCRKCRKLRVVTLEHCEHCGAKHAAPAPDETEVFEESATKSCVVLGAR